MEQTLSVITLGVADIDRSCRFYEDGLGWQPRSKKGGLVYYQIGAIALALFPRVELAAYMGVEGEGAGYSGIALAHNVRGRDRVDAVMRQAEAAGAEILKPPQEVFWGGYAGCFADPDGYPWEVVWNPKWESYQVS